MKKKWPFIVLGIFLFVIIVGIIIICFYQFTDIFGEKVIPRKIHSISIRYVPCYDIGTGESLNQNNSVIEFQTISLKGDTLKKLKKQVYDIRENKSTSSKSELVNYELIINDNIIVNVGEQSGSVLKKKKKKNVTIPSSCIEEIQDIVSKNNQKILKNITTENVLLKMNKTTIQIKNEDNLKYIQDSLIYYPITIQSDYKTYNEGYLAELILDNGVVLYLYDTSRIGYLVMKDGERDASTYIALQENLLDFIQKIYDVSTK